MYIFIYDVLV
jgi:hypothetical protein